MDFLKLYEEIYRTLPGGNMQKLINACYEQVQVPILVVDIMYNVLAIAPDQPTGDYFWDYLLEHRGFETDQIANLYKDGIIQSAEEKTTPYVVDWGSSKDNPKIQGIIRVNNIVEGYVTMNCRSAEITEERLKAMDIIMHVCSYFFKRNESETSMSHAYQRVFAAELFNSRIKSDKQLRTWFHDLGCELQPPYQIAAVSTADSQEKSVLSYIRKYAQGQSPYQILLIQNNVLYILHYNYKDTLDSSESRQAFRTLLAKFSAKCGVSNIFQSLLDAVNYQKQAEDAMTLGRDLNADEHLFHYRDYALPAILLPRIQQMPRDNYIPRAITEIQQYDTRNSTQFLTTLKCLIRNLMSTADTAKELHVHRNTLLYRINKIEELFDIRLRDYHTYMELMVAFYMLELEAQLYK